MFAGRGDVRMRGVENAVVEIFVAWVLSASAREMVVFARKRVVLLADEQRLLANVEGSW